MGTIVILGSGRVGRLEALTLIEDYIDGKRTSRDEKWSLLFPLTSDKDESVAPVVAQAFRWALGKQSIEYSVLVAATARGGDKADPIIGEIVSDAVEAFDVRDPIEAAIAPLDPKHDVVMLAWDDEDHACEKALRAAMARKVKVLDLTYGLQEIVWEEAPGSPVEPKPVEAQPESEPAESSETSEAEVSDYERVTEALRPFVDLLADLVLARMEEKLT